MHVSVYIYNLSQKSLGKVIYFYEQNTIISSMSAKFMDAIHFNIFEPINNRNIRLNTYLTYT
jgi:hypothetical protein